MAFHLLPVRTGNAAENMALDFLLLQRYPQNLSARFRHYTWRTPAFTFGYAQKIAAIRAQLPKDGTFDLCRRPTGGGLVDHREDWTYSLVIPRGHALEEQRAIQSYRVIHEALARALEARGVDSLLQPAADTDKKRPDPVEVCFQRAEVYDVVQAVTRAKIAGAAQKRNKHGLLFQGSIWKPAVETAVDWDQFQADCTAQLGAAFALEPTPMPWPELNEEEVSGLTEQYSSPEWLEHR
jgi:lipoyl(octanoyl) transferase